MVTIHGQIQTVFHRPPDDGENTTCKYVSTGKYLASRRDAVVALLFDDDLLLLYS